MRLGFILLLWTALTAHVWAEQYVSDQLMLSLTGVAVDPVSAALVDTGKTVVQVSSGTQLTVIQQQQDRSVVETATGQRGWIDNRFLSNTLPLAQRYRQLQQQHQALQTQSDQHINQQQKLQQDNDWLRVKLNQQVSRQADQDDRQRQQLENENRAMAGRLTELELALDEQKQLRQSLAESLDKVTVSNLSESLSEPDIPYQNKTQPSYRYSTLIPDHFNLIGLLIAGFLLGTGILLGRYWQQRQIRKHFNGYKLW